MNNDEDYITNFKPDINQELYSDIAFQMLSAYIQGDKEFTNSLFSSLSDSEDQLLLPGIIYGCVLHMGILLATISESTSSTIEDVFKLYAITYNTEIREKLSEMPTLYPKLANAIAEQYDKSLKKGD